MDLKEYLKTSTIRPQEGDTVEYMNLRSRMLSNVVINSLKQIPGVACSYDADVTGLMEEYKKLKAECGYDLTFNTVMMKVLVECLKAVPRLNAHFLYNERSSSGKLIIKKHIDVALAICMENGETFQVKVLHLEDKSLKETAFLTSEAKRKLYTTDLDEMMFEVSRQRVIGFISQGKLRTALAQFGAACFGKGKIIHLSKSLKSDFLKITGKKRFTDGLGLDELNEGSVCLTNWGPLYDNLNVNITYIPPLYPQVFMMGMGRVKDVKDVIEGEDGNLKLNMKKVLPLCLIFDHKIGGANDLMPFIKKLDEIIEHPEVIHTW